MIFLTIWTRFNLPRRDALYYFLFPALFQNFPAGSSKEQDKPLRTAGVLAEIRTLTHPSHKSDALPIGRF
jgi:hypothetical protein